MFTGLIKELGKITALTRESEVFRLQVLAPQTCQHGLKIGDSVALCGVCLTAVTVQGDRFEVEVTPETAQRSTLGTWHVGEMVNLEKALTLSDGLDGHLVSGHVDGLATMTSRQVLGTSWIVEFRLPNELCKYVAPKGSVALDGISLTVAELTASDRFTVAVIPHTLQNTTLHQMAPGAQVNLEVDLIARYLERLLLNRKPGGEMTLEKLAEYGYMD